MARSKAYVMELIMHDVSIYIVLGRWDWCPEAISLSRRGKDLSTAASRRSRRQNERKPAGNWRLSWLKRIIKQTGGVPLTSAPTSLPTLFRLQIQLTVLIQLTDNIVKEIHPSQQLPVSLIIKIGSFNFKVVHIASCILYIIHMTTLTLSQRRTEVKY